MSEKELNLVKAAYLTQLRHGPFTEEEFMARGAGANLAELLALGYLSERVDAGVKRFSLTELGRSKIKVILAGGVYDVLHVGHLAALTEAKRLGDVLVVVVATDMTVETLKERKPLFPEEDRRVLVEGLKPVDTAILGYEDVGFGFEQVLAEVKPDVVVFGYDQEKLEKVVTEIIRGRKLNVRIIRLSRFEGERYVSSSSLRQRLSEELS